MTADLSLDDRENVLIERLTFLNNEIQKLENEKAVIQRHISLVRKNNVDLRDVKRISSVERAIIERAILKIITTAHGPIKTRSIEIALSYTYRGVKSSTFRSHLKRMEVKEMIKSHKHGHWIAAKSSSKT